MIDTHCHIDGIEFDGDRSELIQRAKAKGISHLIIPAIEPKRYKKLDEVVFSDSMIFCAYGVHPHNASDYNNQVEEIIINKIKNAGKNKVVGVGEIGLDYYYDFVPQNIQKEVFLSQLLIAKQYKKPVIVHNRQSDDDILDLITLAQKQSVPIVNCDDSTDSNEETELKGVLHCFSSDKNILEKVLDLGFYVSFTGNVTFKKSNLDEVVRYVPKDRFMIETDSPYITPVPFRGKRNEPAYVSFVAEKIAEIRKESVEKIIEQTTENAMKLFKLPILIFLLSFSLIKYSAVAQVKAVTQQAIIQEEDDEYDEQYYEEEPINPYKRNIGVGLFAGPNTIVVTEYYKPGQGPRTGNNPSIDEVDRSYEGFLFYGGSLQYSPVDYLILEGSYYTSKSTKLSADNPNRQPDYYNGLELTSLWIANPTKRINFFGGIGATILMNKLDGESTIATGLNFSVGFIGNIKIEGVGLFNLVAQWRLNPRFGRQEMSVPDPNRDQTKPDSKYATVDIEASQFFSMPRFTLVWYPEF